MPDFAPYRKCETCPYIFSRFKCLHERCPAVIAEMIAFQRRIDDRIHMMALEAWHPRTEPPNNVGLADANFEIYHQFPKNMISASPYLDDVAQGFPVPPGCLPVHSSHGNCFARRVEGCLVQSRAAGRPDSNQLCPPAGRIALQEVPGVIPVHPLFKRMYEKKVN